MRNDEELLEILKMNDPAAGENLERWAETATGRRVYARIVAERDKNQRILPAKRKTARLALAAIGVVVLVGGIVTAVLVGTGRSPEVAQSTTTSAGQSSIGTVAGPGERVDKIVALANVVRAARAVTGSGGYEVHEERLKDSARYADRAIELGIIGLEERDDVLAGGAVRRGTFALWLWRVLGDQLDQIQEANLSDLARLSPEEREAVVGVVGAGILDGRPNGRFEADQALTVEEQEKTLERLEKLFGFFRDVG